MARPKLPLPADFFRCPMLSSDEETEFLRKASANAADLVAHSILDGTGPLQWTLESNMSDIHIYTANDPTLPSHVLCYAGVVEIQASVNEVASLFQTHTTDEYKEFRRRFASDLLDGHNLYTLVRPTDEHPLKAVNIKWTVNEMPGSGLLKNRDWCFLESMYEFEQDGRRGWVRAVYSTELGCCPDFESTLGVVRGTFFRSGHVFSESDRPGYIRATHLFQASMNGGFQKGLVPSWEIKAGVRRRIRGISDIQTFVRETRLNQGPLIDTCDLVAKSARARCHLCNKKFGPLIRKARCRKCGEVHKSLLSPTPATQVGTMHRWCATAAAVSGPLPCRTPPFERALHVHSASSHLMQMSPRQ
ncbi:hypothetical protein, variant [Aphanomyces invadans]|uniref:START domain-containing protein n=1 Tax=Aphanomyces invadans TaxID=157072 RepID=A0A024ULD1_9STRA|nr:hypothetical protein, variant [Aphanomyces invadans]ETW06975.1 hypothetical protein, variant [Aphanomyces invadans]|eukprot:XP_008865050.1 hypothetical protein, variant [Aphanomyces invadans]